ERSEMLATRYSLLATSSVAHATDEFFDPVARHDELLVAGGEAGADVALAVFAEGDARHHGDLLRRAQVGREVFLAQAGRGHVGKRVEAPARRVALEADFVEA